MYELNTNILRALLFPLFIYILLFKRIMLFMCVQCYLHEFNVFYAEVSNQHALPLLIIFGKSEHPPLPTPLLIF